MTRRKVKTFLMQLIERDHPGQSIEQILLAAYCEHGTERAAAQALGITQQSFNAWKFRLGLDNAMLMEHMRRSTGIQREEA
ncbi:MAG: hypothetical protein HXY40_00720 [Chloroflexi bacterium]|nr:hypothetical protein [Chloroflexota bacterium]